MFIPRPQVERGRVVLILLGGLGNQVGDLDFGLAEDNASLLLSGGLGLDHMVLSRDALHHSTTSSSAAVTQSVNQAGTTSVVTSATSPSFSVTR